MEETYSADDYDYEDFESEDGDHSKSPGKRIGTPHSSKKAVAPDVDWGADDEEDEGGNDELDVEGQDLESYMKHKSEANGTAAPQEDLACELKPLEGYRPTKENADEARLLHKLGYDSHSNQGSPQKGVRVITNSPSPSMKSGKVTYQSFASNDIDTENSTKFGTAQGSNPDEFPSTRTSKDQKESPTFSKQKSPRGNASKVGFSLNDEKFMDSKNTSEAGDYDITQEANPKVRVKVDANYIENFKAMMGSSVSGLPKANQPSPLDASALDLLPTRKPTVDDERENAERVDALLMELFPERFEGKKGKKGKGTKKASAAAAGYSKNQVYGLAAPRGPAALPSVEYLHSSSSHALTSLQHSAQYSSSSMAGSDADDAPQVPLMASLDQQLKLLKKELKAKDDKITRLTEHAVMMGTHMDRLKGEAAHLTIQLREANGELEAKEARLQEALKQRKKAKKAAQMQQGSGGGGGGGSADVAVLENENARLREREQALMDAIEELSNQNEDLIDKLKESMERELVLSSKRAAQISQNVSALAEQALHGGNNHHLPQIGARAEAGAGPLRTQSEPVVTGAPKRAGRKKRVS